MYGYIYKTTNLVNSKIYIGQHKAKQFDDWYKGSGILLWNAINKYGWSNFKVELLVECESDEELNSEEIRLIAEYNSTDRSVGYNISKGGHYFNLPSGRIGINKEGKYKIVNKQDLQSYLDDDWIIGGLPLSEERRQNISKSWEIRRLTPVSEETRRKQSEARRGKLHGPLSEETKHKISEANKGKEGACLGKRLMHHSVTNEMKYFDKNNISNMKNEGWILGSNREYSDKLSKLNSGCGNPFYNKCHTEETKRKLSEGREGNKNPCYNKKWITRDTENRRVSENELDEYFNEGWVLGRYVSKSTRDKQRSNALKRKRGQHNGRFI